MMREECRCWYYLLLKRVDGNRMEKLLVGRCFTCIWMWWYGRPATRREEETGGRSCRVVDDDGKGASEMRVDVNNTDEEGAMEKE